MSSVQHRQDAAILEMFSGNIKVAVTEDHLGEHISADMWSGFAEVLEENGKTIYSASLKVPLQGSLIEAKKIYQKQPVAGFKLKSIKSVVALFNGLIHRTQLEYERISQAELRSMLQQLDLRGGAGKKEKVTVEVKKSPPKKRSSGRRRRLKVRVKVGETIQSGRVSSGKRRRAYVDVLNRRGITQAGKAWLDLYLNPMGPDQPAMCGIPDGSAVKSVVAEFALNEDVTMPTTAWYNSNATSSSDITWANDNITVIPALESIQNISMFIGQLPLASDLVMIRIYAETPTEFVMNTDLDATRGSDLFTKQTFPSFVAYSDIGSIWRTTEKFGYLQAIIRNDQVYDMLCNVTQFRLVARGLTGIFTAPQLETQGFVSGAQVEAKMTTDFTTAYVNDTDSNKIIALTGVYDALVVGNVANGEITQTYHTAYTSKCVEGFYMPLHSSSTDFRFQAPQIRRVVAGKHADDIKNNAVSRTFAQDYVFDDWNVGVVWFTGISAKASIRIKSREVIQGVPVGGTTLGISNKAGADEDMNALEVAYRVRNKMAHAYPSSYNDFGILGDIVGGFIDAIPIIGPTIKNLGSRLLGGSSGTSKSASQEAPVLVGPGGVFNPQAANQMVSQYVGSQGMMLANQMMNKLTI